MLQRPHLFQRIQRFKLTLEQKRHCDGIKIVLEYETIKIALLV